MDHHALSCSATPVRAFLLALAIVTGAPRHAAAEDRELGYIWARFSHVTAEFERWGSHTSSNATYGPNGESIRIRIEGRDTTSNYWATAGWIDVDATIGYTFPPRMEGTLFSTNGMLCRLSGTTGQVSVAASMNASVGYEDGFTPLEPMEHWAHARLNEHRGSDVYDAVKIVDEGSGGVSVNDSFLAEEAIYFNPAQADQLIIELRLCVGVGIDSGVLILRGVYEVATKHSVRLHSYRGEVEIMPGGDEALSVINPPPGSFFSEHDRIFTSLDSEARFEFLDESQDFGSGTGFVYCAVIVRELTDMKIAAFKSERNAIRVRLWLKGGEVAAEVNKTPEQRSDFAVKTPTATAGVRGTTFEARHNPAYGDHEETSVFTMYEGGPLIIEPEGAGLQAVAGRPGDVTRVTSNSVSGSYSEILRPMVPGYRLDRFYSLENPSGLAMTPAGELVVIGGESNAVVRVNAGGSGVELASLPETPGGWCGPLVRPDGTVIVGNRFTGEIVQLSGGSTSTLATVVAPLRELALKTNGTILATSLECISAVSPAGTVTQILTGLAEPRHITSLAADDSAVFEQGNPDRLFRLNETPPASATALTPDFAERLSALAEVAGLGLLSACGPEYDYSQSELLAVDTQTGSVTTIGSRFSRPSGIAGDVSCFYVADEIDDVIYRLRRIDPGTPAMGTSVGGLGFGNVLVGTSVSRTNTVDNVGTSDLVIHSVVSPRSEVTLMAPALPLTIPPGSSRSLVFGFAPTNGADVAGTIAMVGNDPLQATNSIPFSGRGLAPTIISVQPRFALPGDYLEVQALNVGTNPAAVELRLNGEPVSPVHGSMSFGRMLLVFRLPDDCPSGQVSFTVTAGGLTSDAATYTVGAGSGPQPVLDLPSPQQFQFGAVPVGASRRITAPLLNCGDADLLVTNVNITAPGFTVIEPSIPFTIAPGGARDIEVEFTPTEENYFYGDLILLIDSPQVPQVAYVIGGMGIADVAGPWRDLHFGDDAGNPAISGDGADPDGDQVNNLLERALGSDPLTADLPSPIDLSMGANSDIMNILLRIDSGALDLVYHLEATTDLMTWQPLASYYPQPSSYEPLQQRHNDLRLKSSSAVPGTSLWQFNEDLLLFDPATRNRRFLRLRIEPPE